MRVTTRSFPLGGMAGLVTLLAGPALAASDHANAAQIAHGKYLADAGDCVACHTAPGGKPFAGGLMMKTPFGPISTPNITPDRETGIGNWSDDDFYNAFHKGVGRDGQHLYPVMPFPWYTKVTRDDVLAIKTYLFSLPPEHAPRKPNKLVFPFNIRGAMIGWDALLLRVGEFKPDPSQSAQINRGAYLVQGLAHCGECHNGNSVLGATSISEPLQGGPIDQWYAPNITADKHEGIGRFSDQQIFTYLKTGTEKDMGVVVGPMAQTQHESLRRLTDDDLRAVVAYLKSTPAKQGFVQEKPSQAPERVAINATAYLNYCASCHQQNGQGFAGAVPKLVGNGAVTAQGPQTVMRVVLGGIPAQGSYGAMPAIGARMTDQEVADATNYVRSSWGNAAPAQAGPGQAGGLRKVTETLLAANLPGGCPKLPDSDLGQAVRGAPVAKALAATTEENMLENADTLIGDVRARVKHAKQADIINVLTIGYCPVVMANRSLTTQAQKSEALDEFSERVYTQIVSTQR